MRPNKKDIRRLLEDMDEIAKGNCGEVDTSLYKNPLYGEKLNAVIRSLKRANNLYVMRMNETMEAVGDNALIKDTFDQVTSQTASISQMKDASREMENSISHISASMGAIQENTHEISDTFQVMTVNMNDSIRDVQNSTARIQVINGQMQDFKEKIDKIGEIIDIVKKVSLQSKILALNASIEAARAGEDGRNFAIVAQEMQQLSLSTTESAENITDYVRQLGNDTNVLAVSMNETAHMLSEGNAKAEFSLQELMQMNSQISAIQEQVDSIFQAIDTQNSSAAGFSRQTEQLAQSYHVLSNDCIALGKHVFQIGRYIDKTRTDMVRGNSAITELDWLRVFQVDHFVLTWRVYNNIVGFEQLLAKQVENPSRCKLGKWLASQTDPALTGSSEFRRLADAHNTFHTYAARSWNAKQEGDNERALQAFRDTCEAFQALDAAIRSVQDKMHALGRLDETKVPPVAG